MKVVETTPLDAASLARNKYIWIVLLCFGTFVFGCSFFFPPTMLMLPSRMFNCPTNVYKALGYECGSTDADKLPILAHEIKGIEASARFIDLVVIPQLEEEVISLPDDGKSKTRLVYLKVETSVVAVKDNLEVLNIVHQERKKISFYCFNNTEGGYDCPGQTIGRVFDIKHDHYVFVFKILNPQELSEKQFTGFKSFFSLFNYNFDNYLGYLKWLFFGLSVAGFMFYANGYANLPKGAPTVEQKILFAMGLALVAMNEPFLRFLNNQSENLSHIYVIATSLISTLLVGFWLFLLERLSSSKDTINKWKKGGIVLLCLIHLVVSIKIYWTLAVHQFTNYFVDYLEDIDIFIYYARTYFFPAFIALVALISIWKSVQIYRKKDALVGKDRNAFIFTACFVLCSLFFTASGSYQILNHRGPRVVLMFGVTTLYTLLLLLLYAPLESDVKELKSRQREEDLKGPYSDLEMSEPNRDDIHLRNNDTEKNEYD